MRDLEAALGQNGPTEFREMWDSVMSHRAYFKDVPDEFQDYLRLLHKADFSRCRLIFSEEQKCCQKALDYLNGILHYDPLLFKWLDRPVIFDGADAILPDVEEMPRLITSKSMWSENQNRASSTKRDIKHHLLKSALDEVKNLQKKQVGSEVARHLGVDIHGNDGVAQ